MHLPQVIVLVMLSFNFCFGLLTDGRPRSTRGSWIVAGTVLDVALLYWGGFFTH